jgi:hypothetical protein
MRNFTKSVLFVLLCVVAMTSCDKKEDEIVPKTIMTYDGKDYELSKALLIDYGTFPPNEGNGQELFLSSSGVTVRESGGKIDSIYGRGHGIFFQLFGVSSNQLGEGEYTFDFSQGPFKAKSFFYSYATFDNDFVDWDADLHEMIAGTITVKKINTEYSITFDCVENSGKHITGFYKGALKVYDEK